MANRQRIAEAEGALAKMEAAIAHHKQTTLPQLWGALSALKVLPILHADYDAKLERQAKRGLVLDKVSGPAHLRLSKSLPADAMCPGGCRSSWSRGKTQALARSHATGA
jgi:hypothetical protein